LNCPPSSNWHLRRARQLKLFEKEHPGDSVRVDVKVVKIAKEKVFQYTAIDDCTRMRVLRLYSRLNQHSSLAFLRECTAMSAKGTAGGWTFFSSPRRSRSSHSASGRGKACRGVLTIDGQRQVSRRIVAGDQNSRITRMNQADLTWRLVGNEQEAILRTLAMMAYNPAIRLVSAVGRNLKAGV